MDLLLRLLSLMFRGTALMFGLVGAAFALACLGGVFSDKLDALTHFAPLWLGMGVAAITMGWIFARGDERKAMVGLGLVVVAACSVPDGPRPVGRRRAKRLAERPDDLKIIQFNVWHDNRTSGKGDAMDPQTGRRRGDRGGRRQPRCADRHRA
jgi:endonuclease/exonuclease/phosphatase (EEP) superfamily protein YafD